MPVIYMAHTTLHSGFLIWMLTPWHDIRQMLDPTMYVVLSEKVTDFCPLYYFYFKKSQFCRRRLLFLRFEHSGILVGFKKRESRGLDKLW